MSSPRSAVAPRIYAAVFVGGCLGGATRIAIDHAIDLDSWPWDIVAINIVGSTLLGAIVGWFAMHDPPWWIPGVGAGLMGGFTTFSAMAAPHSDAPLPGFVLLFGTLVGASIAAAFGWHTSEAIALRHANPRLPLDVEHAEAEVEGYEGYENDQGPNPESLESDGPTP